MGVILKAENVSKQYRLGLVGTGTLSHDLNRFWARIRGKEDPYLKVGAVNDRATKAESEYVWALKDINFEVQKGEILGIIGKNGAGKSTLLKILSRVTGPTTGTIKTKGTIASLLEVGTGFHPELTGRENVYLNGAILGMRKSEIKEKIDEIVEFSGCEMYIDTPVKRYSSGMRVRLAFAVAAHLEPDILIVDEVLAVGDAEFQKKAIGKMQDISSGEGRTVIFVSHNMAAVKSLCSRAIVLVNGESVYSGDTISSVDFYLNETRAIRRDITIFDSSHRRGNMSKQIEMLKIESRSNNISVRGDIEFEVFLRNNGYINQEVTLTGTICNNQEESLGSFFTQSFVLTNESDFSKTVTVMNHNLSVGEYYLNISISSGCITKSNLVPIDHAYQALGFEILSENSDIDYVMKWNKNWGSFFFESKIEGN